MIIRRCSIFLSVVMLLAACGSTRGPVTSGSGVAPDAVGADSDAEGLVGLQFTLSEVASPPAADKSIPRGSVEPLGDAQLRAALARAPKWKKPSDRQVAPKPIETERVPPRVRQAQPVEIQAGVSPVTEAAAGPLRVVRFSPEGSVEMATTVSVTFNQPMVPLTTHGAAAKNVPVRLEPQPPGRWRWIGTDTVLFEADGRFPMATEYRVVVPQGTRAQSGAALEKEVRFDFATSAPVLQEHLVGERIDLSPFIFLRFNQRIDPDDVIGHLVLTSQVGDVELEEAAVAELPENSQLARATEASPDGMWMLVRHELLAPKEQYTFTVTPGAPSAEGSRGTTEKQVFGFKSVDRTFRIKKHSCGYGEICRPRDHWEILLNRRLDQGAFDANAIAVDPPVKGLEVTASRDRIVLLGEKQPGVEYQVTLPASLLDAYGQSLGRPQTFTFQVGSYAPQLWGADEATVILSPKVARSLTFSGRNLKNVRARIYSSAPSRWPEFNEWRSKRRGEQAEDNGKSPPGALIQEQVLPVEDGVDKMLTIPVDLSAPMADGVQHAIVWITAESASSEEKVRLHEEIIWLQLTDLRIHPYSDDDELLAWVTRISDGQPVPEAVVSFLEDKSGKTSRTDADGRARLRLPKKPGKRPDMLVVRAGNETAFATPSRHLSPGDRPDWIAARSAGAPLWSTNTDRGVYRPGETVRIHGWMRFVESTRGSDLRLPEQPERKIEWHLELPQGGEVRTGVLKLTKNGGFDLAIDLPEDVSLGRGFVGFKLSGQEYARHHESFQIQEYRRPEYEVRVQSTPGPHLVGSQATLTAAASYYTGGPLTDAPARWSVSSREARYTPPGHGEFHFGRFRNLWGVRALDEDESRDDAQKLAGATDKSGRHSLTLALRGMKTIAPVTVQATATVEDLNRQAWTDTRALLVHPSRYYLGVRTASRWVGPGAEIPLEWIVTTVEGELLADIAGRFQLYKVEHRQVDGVWRENRSEIAECRGISGTNPGMCRFLPRESGSYIAVGSVTDPEGRRNESEMRFFVEGPASGAEIPGSDADDVHVRLLADRTSYTVGDTARLMISTSVYPATGLLTIDRMGLVESRVVRIDGPSQMVELPLGESHHPEVHLHLRLVAPEGREIGEAAELTLRVDNPERELRVTARPKLAYAQPGEKNTAAVEVVGADGKPVSGAEVALFVVDEAILALNEHEFVRPERQFFTSRLAGIEPHLVFSPYRGEQERLLLTRSHGGEAGGRIEMRARQGASAILLRRDFRPLAVFRANVKTDARGRVKVDFKMPDTLTRYRVVALAAAGADRFGSAESTITARLPLMVRPSPPRFSHVDDRFELPVVLHNESDERLEVTVAGRARGIALGAAGGDRLGFKTSVPAGGRVEVPFPAAATAPGEASFQFVATAGDQADGTAGSFPVQLPTKMETFATFGVIDKGAARHTIAPPKGVRSDAGGLEVVISSSQLESLTDALLALMEYPYGCTEQVASRLLAAISMSDVARHIQSERMIDRQAFKEMIVKSIERLEELQRADGGFGYWPGAGNSDAYLSVHATHALTRARNAEYPVSRRAFSQALQYISRLASGESKHAEGPAGLSVQAYALSALQIAGYPEIKHAAPLLASRPIDQFPLEALGWMLPTFAEAGQSAEVRKIVRHLSNQLVETAQTAQFKTGYTEGAYVILHSSRRSDAVITDALVDADPYNTALPKLVEGLLAARQGGRWATTQENAFALMAIKNYLDSFVSRHPHFDARVWRGEELILQEQYRRRTPRQVRASIPMNQLVAGGAATDLVIEKDGVQRLYYRLALRYTGKNPPTEPVSHGFTVSRSYAAVDDPEDVVRLEDGRWRIRAGARVRISVDLVAPIRRHHVALVDHLPAGLEAINPNLAVSAGGAPEQRFGRWIPWAWYDHQNLRDDRAEAFATSLDGGIYSYSYTARATTPGTFVAPAATAEEMYNPETFGATAAAMVVVER